MTYNFNFALSADISADTVAEMIRTVVEQQTGRKVKRIRFDFREDDADSFTRSSTTVFNGCTIYFGDEKPQSSVSTCTSSSSLAAQLESIEKSGPQQR